MKATIAFVAMMCLTVASAVAQNQNSARARASSSDGGKLHASTGLSDKLSVNAARCVSPRNRDSSTRDYRRK